jgi:hypothetical protein
MAKCNDCGIELAGKQKRAFSKAEGGLCGECATERQNQAETIGYDEYNG